MFVLRLAFIIFEVLKKSRMETINLIGSLIDDAKARVKDDKEFVTFTVAVDDKRDKAVSRYYSCILYGSNKNRIKYLVKGTKVSVIGEFYPSIYHEEGRDPILNLNVKVGMLEMVLRTFGL